MQRIAEEIRAGSFASAIRRADAELVAHPGDKRILTLRGIAEEKIKIDREALSSFEQALASDPNYVPALRGSVEIRFRSGDPGVISALDRLLRMDEADQTAHAMRGVLAWKQKDCAVAIEHFTKAGAVLDREPGALNDYASCLVHLGREEQALGVYERIEAFNPSDRRAACAVAALRLDRKQYQEALNALQKSASTPDADVLALRSQAYEGLGDTPRAVENLRQAIVLAPDRAALYVQFAWLSFDHSSYQVGIDMLNAGLTRLPRSAELYLARGILHVEKGEYEKADRDFTRADLLDPRQATGTAAQALSALQTDRLDEAIAYARANLKAHPGDALSAYVLGEALLKHGAHPGSPEFAEAQSAAQTAVRAKPDFLAAGDLLSRICLQNGDTEAAIRECRRVLAISPDDETSLYRLVRALKKRGSESDLAEVPALLKRLNSARKRVADRQAEASRYRLVEPGK